MSRFLAHVDKEGRIIPANPGRMLRYVGKGGIWVSVHEEPTESLRSSESNRYLWGVLYRQISLETGNDPETIHLALKREAVRTGVLEPEYVMLGEQMLEADPSTRTDPDTFTRYCRWVEDYALHKLGIHIEDHL